MTKPVSRPTIVVIGLLLLVAIPAFLLWWHEPVSMANFQRIQVGMPQPELYGMLGRPDYDTCEVGLVEDADTYLTNAHLSETEKRALGYRDYRRQQWSSTEITIIVILDSDERVACRYSGGGQTRNHLGFVADWFSRLFGVD